MTTSIGNAACRDVPMDQRATRNLAVSLCALRQYARFAAPSPFQPTDVLRRQLDVERLQRILELAHRELYDDRDHREIVGQAVGQRDMYRVLAKALAELD